jgi:hypothetical protein
MMLIKTTNDLKVSIISGYAVYSIGQFLISALYSIKHFQQFH